MGETKKVKSTGRYGPRYGVGIRKRLLKVEKIQKKKQTCPKCGKPTVIRVSPGIFKCKKCDETFAGGSYTPTTMTGRIVGKMVSQKKFLSNLSELISSKEEAGKEGEESEKEILEEVSEEKTVKEKEKKEQEKKSKKTKEENKESLEDSDSEKKKPKKVSEKEAIEENMKEEKIEKKKE